MTEHPNRFSTRAVHAGTNHIEGAVNTPVFLSSTIVSRRRDTQDGPLGRRPMLYTRLTGINAEATAAKIMTLEVLRTENCSHLAWARSPPRCWGSSHQATTSLHPRTSMVERMDWLPTTCRGSGSR